MTNDKKKPAEDYIPPPPERKADPRTSTSLRSGEKPEEELARLEAELLVVKERIRQLQTPFQEYPKMVDGRTFASREEEDAGKPAEIPPVKAEL